MQSIRAIFKSYSERRIRRNIISKLLCSRMVSEGTESGTLVRMAEEIRQYIDSGEYDKNALPNGYHWAGGRAGR